MGKAVRIAATAIVLIIGLLFVLRCCLAADKSVLSDPVVTDALRSAAADGDAAVTSVERIDREMSENGWFCAYALWYCEEASEVQVSVRWNDSAYTYTDMEKGHEYAFHLLNETTGETCPATAVEKTDRFMYHYRHLVIPGAVIGAEDQISVVMELRDGHEDSQVVKYALQPLKAKKLPSAVLRALETP